MILAKTGNNLWLRHSKIHISEYGESPGSFHRASEILSKKLLPFDNYALGDWPVDAALL